MKSTKDNRLQAGRTLTPVMGVHGCLGHLLHTARGWRAFDSNDKAIGTFPTQSDAAQAVLTLGRVSQ
jgi:hypothetical protein